MRQRAKYSAAEQHLLALLPDNGKQISTTELARAHYGDRINAKKAPQQAVAWTLRSLARKVRQNREKFLVRSTKHAGPYEMSHWVEHRKS